MGNSSHPPQFVSPDPPAEVPGADISPHPAAQVPAADASPHPAAQIPGTDISWSTIRLIVLTAAVVFVLLCIPFLFVFKNFVKFESVDKYLGLTEGVSPKILVKISKELEAGYSKNFTITASSEIQKKANATIVANAGSTKSYDVPNPAGLLEINRRIVSPLDTASAGGGLLCIARTKVTILPIAASISSCVDAVQRGPLLNSSFSSRTKAWKDKYRRTVVAVDDEGKLILLVTQDAATLDGVATYLFVTRRDLRISDLLNLDGGGSTGLIFNPGKTAGEAFASGNVNGLVASAISIR